MLYCNECGGNINANDKFCTSCGTKVKRKSEEKDNSNNFIQADLKVEVTNATTEKAFKKVGEASIATKNSIFKLLKKTILIVLILLIPITITLFFIQKNIVSKNVNEIMLNEYKYDTPYLSNTNRSFMQLFMSKELEVVEKRIDEIIERKAQPEEKRNCVMHYLNSYDGSIGVLLWLAEDSCNLSPMDIRRYEKELDIRK